LKGATLVANQLPSEVRLRSFAGAADYPQMLAVIEASKVVDRIERSDTLESLAHSYSRLTNCDPYQDMIMAEAHGELLGYGRCWWLREHTGIRSYVHFGWVQPDWRHRGIGSAILSYLQKRLHVIALKHPADGPRYLESLASDSEVDSEALLQRDGYIAVRHSFDMVRPTLDNLPVFELPPGLIVRPVQPEHYRLIWEADAEAFADHWGAIAQLEDDYQAWLNHPVIFTPELWQVAWDGDQIAGMVRSFIDAQENEEYGRRRGYTEFISTRRPWRRRGLAYALIIQSLQLLREQGMAEAALNVDTENTSGALGLYERCGFRPVKRSTLYRKPLN
jgi:mycothiol synthase